MGRYAFFTTGLEYKFRFGIQLSEDIRSFGGVGSYENYSKGYSTHHWDSKDCEEIRNDIRALAESLDISLPIMEAYEKSLEGTHTLHSDLYTLYEKDFNEKALARFILGCLLYHQLLYTETLEADYEG
jgi:hypothetical protein